MFERHVLLFTVALLVIAWSNNRLIRRFSTTDQRHWPSVTILVPARNEEGNIYGNVHSLLGQDYPDFQVLVLNDGSTDGTREILEELEEKHERLAVFQGKAIPKGWYGKHWACEQLGQKARGELILFTDADTLHEPEMLKGAVSLMADENLDLLTAFVRQKTFTFGERLLVPFPFWSIINFLPLFVGYRFRNHAFTAVNGQFMLFRKSSYRAAGGHEAVRMNAVDDIALGKLIKKLGMRWRIHDASHLVSCRMYRSFREAFDGFSKNFFAIFEYRILPSIFIWIWIILIQWYPMYRVGSFFVSGHGAPPYYSAAALVLHGLLWGFTLRRFQFPMSILLYHPLLPLMAAVTGFRSLVLTLKGGATWKGRTLEKPKISWI